MWLVERLDVFVGLEERVESVDVFVGGKGGCVCESDHCEVQLCEGLLGPTNALQMCREQRQ